MFFFYIGSKAGALILFGRRVFEPGVCGNEAVRSIHDCLDQLFEKAGEVLIEEAELQIQRPGESGESEVASNPDEIDTEIEGEEPPAPLKKRPRLVQEQADPIGPAGVQSPSPPADAPGHDGHVEDIE